jgi:DNA repair exonuclease SbcCD ATPase subunit
MVTPVVTGRQTLDGIEQALKEIGETVDWLNAELKDINENKATLVAQRLEAFGQLAKFRAELALMDGVIDEADQLSAQVRTTLQARQRTIEGLRRREDDAGKERGRLVAEQQPMDEEIARLEARLDAIGEEARAALAAGPAYAERAKRHAELEDMVAKAAEKAERASAEEATKGAPYRQDPLFAYLWERKFGTSDYETTGLARYLDRWVAGLIGYQDARANFAMLTAIPQRLAAHVERLRQSLKTEREALDAMEAEKIRALAGADLPADLRAAHDRRGEHTAKLEKLNAELVETGRQLNHYAEGLDPSFREAVEKTARFLQGQSLNGLIAQARQTKEVDDDEIVALIGKFADEVGRLERVEKTKREALDAAFERKQELLRIAAEFRRSRYDLPGSVFEPGSGGKELLGMLLQGAISAADYWMRMQGRQRWRGRPADSYRRSENVPPSRGSRGGSSGPDFRTGGGF